jgi:hypothetical protein
MLTNETYGPDLEETDFEKFRKRNILQTEPFVQTNQTEQTKQTKETDQATIGLHGQLASHPGGWLALLLHAEENDE